jgi:hypothetical protein
LFSWDLNSTKERFPVSKGMRYFQSASPDSDFSMYLFMIDLNVPIDLLEVRVFSEVDFYELRHLQLVFALYHQILIRDVLGIIIDH